MIFSDQQHIYFQQFQADHPLFHQNYDPPSISPHSVLSSSQTQDFQGISPTLMRRSMPFSGMERCEEDHGLDDEMSDDGGSQLLGDKKRRLNLEQVKGLEKSFELGNKLELERKMQLARALGLQPRQIAIWFQNRRARSKTKQLERDYDLLKTQYDALKANNDSLKSKNEKLHAELLALKSREPNSGNRPINLNTETNEGAWSNGSDENSCDHQVNTAGITQIFLQRSSSTAPDLDHSHERLNQTVGDGTFCSMFNGMDDNHGFWPWSTEQNQTFH